MKKIKMLLLLAGSAVLLSSCGYNSMVNKRENVKKEWAQVEAQYQRRADLIPNLVNTVKGAANFEKSTLTQVVEARAKATQVTVDADNLTPQAIQKYQQAQNQLSGALSRLLVTVERYPDLKANKNYMALQAQLEGTENRINVARMEFNNSVNDYNAYIQRFPHNIVANMFGFKQKGYFQATAGSEKAPEVKF